jgi:hypothetical protein
MSYVYPVPDYRLSNSNVGSFTQAVGPFAPSTAAGYGNPGGISVGMMENQGLARQQGSVLVYEAMPNRPSELWAMRHPTVVYIDEYDEDADASARPRINSSTLGNVQSSNGYASYNGMAKRAASYGHYR